MALNERQQARKQWLIDILAVIDARILGDITGGSAEMTFNGRSLKRYSLPELDNLRKRFESELRGLEAKEQGGSRLKPIRVRF